MLYVPESITAVIYRYRQTEKNSNYLTMVALLINAQCHGLPDCCSPNLTRVVKAPAALNFNFCFDMLLFAFP